eukprot:747979-Hanusia_phi.AAC.8
MSVLLVGDGNFSFSRSLCTSPAAPSISSLVATSYDSKSSLLKKYGDGAQSNIDALLACGWVVRHEVDGRNLERYFPDDTRFDYIYFMHPLVDPDDRVRLVFDGKINNGEDIVVANRLLIADFLRSAKHFLSHPHGEIRVACKDTYPYTWWRVSQLGKLARPLKLKDVELFRNEDFPGYEPRTVEMDKAFPSSKSKMYKFAVLKEADGVEFEEQWYGEKELKLQIVCSICEKQFTSEADKARHLKTEKHHIRAKLE